MAPPNYTEEDLFEAVFDVTDNGMSLNKSAQKHGVPKQTLSARMRGRGGRDEVEKESRLTPGEGQRLVDWIIRQESLGYAPSHAQIRACVVNLLTRDGEDMERSHWA